MLNNSIHISHNAIKYHTCSFQQPSHSEHNSFLKDVTFPLQLPVQRQSNHSIVESTKKTTVIWMTCVYLCLNAKYHISKLKTASNSNWLENHNFSCCGNLKLYALPNGMDWYSEETFCSITLINPIKYYCMLPDCDSSGIFPNLHYSWMVI